MSGQTKKTRVFGRCDKDVAWSRVMRAQCSLRPSASRIGFVMSLLAASGFLMALDATTLAFTEGYRGLWTLPRGLESMLTTMPPAIGASLMVILMLICFQTIIRLVSMFRTDEPIIMADYNGLMVRSGGGAVGFSWADIEKVRDYPGLMILKLGNGSPATTEGDKIRSPRLVWIPTLFLEGGAQGLMNAIAHVRPDLVRHWWPDAPVSSDEDDVEELAMVGFGPFKRKEDDETKLEIRGQSVTPIKLSRY